MKKLQIFLFYPNYTTFTDRRKQIKDLIARRSDTRGKRNRRKKKEDISEESRQEAAEIVEMWDALSKKIINCHPNLNKVAKTILNFEKTAMEHFHAIKSKSSND